MCIFGHWFQFGCAVVHITLLGVLTACGPLVPKLLSAVGSLLLAPSLAGGRITLLGALTASGPLVPKRLSAGYSLRSGGPTPCTLDRASVVSRCPCGRLAS